MGSIVNKLSVIKAGIVGGTGYTGVELLRLLSAHPNVEIDVITSRGEAGVLVSELYPNLRGQCDIIFSEPDSSRLAECDVVFFATPHGVAQGMMAELAKTDVKVVDLSADFRIKDVAVWEQWYGQKHNATALLETAVYGLPELHREGIKEAKLVAAAGCYPTSVILGFLPLLEKGLVDVSDLIANSASGVSGAGRQAKIGNLFAEMGESFQAYAAGGHRHLPEITQELQAIASIKQPVQLTFVPHLLPITRGIHSTLYANLLETDVDLQSVYEERYKDEVFVDVLPAGSHPQTRTVKGSNMVRIAVHRIPNTQKALILVVEDNLTKGAAGQAVQCMNIMFDLPEASGLQQIALIP